MSERGTFQERKSIFKRLLKIIDEVLAKRMSSSN